MKFSPSLACVTAVCTCYLAPSALSDVLIDDFTLARSVNPSVEGGTVQSKQDWDTTKFGRFFTRSIAAYPNGQGGSSATVIGGGEASLNTAVISNPNRRRNGVSCMISYSQPYLTQRVFDWSDSNFSFGIRTWATKMDSDVMFELRVSDDSGRQVTADLRAVIVGSASDPIATVTKSIFTPYEYGTPGQIDWSRIWEVGIYLTPALYATTPAEMAVRINYFSYVPAPGAAALLGAAGLLGRRRRA